MSSESDSQQAYSTSYACHRVSCDLTVCVGCLCVDTRRVLCRVTVSTRCFQMVNTAVQRTWLRLWSIGYCRQDCTTTLPSHAASPRTNAF